MSAGRSFSRTAKVAGVCLDFDLTILTFWSLLKRPAFNYWQILCPALSHVTSRWITSYHHLAADRILIFCRELMKHLIAGSLEDLRSNSYSSLMSISRTLSVSSCTAIYPWVFWILKSRRPMGRTTIPRFLSAHTTHNSLLLRVFLRDIIWFL